LSSIKTGLHVPPIVETPAAADAAGRSTAWHGHWGNEAHTQAFAQRLARCPAITHATLALQGDLGAGKTTFVRHLLRALGVQGRIKSPSYAVVEPHSALPCPLMPAGLPLAIWHFDFYRFTDPREWEDAGFRELFASPGLKLVEWPERAGAFMPPVDAELHIEPAPLPSHPEHEPARDARLTALTPTGQQLLLSLKTQR